MKRTSPEPRRRPATRGARMQSYDLSYDEGRYAAANAAASERAAFIRRTYGHLAGAILAFVAAEAILFSSGAAEQFVAHLFGYGRMAWLVLLGVFIVGGFAAQAMARSAVSKPLQYAGLALYVGLWTVIFLPILYAAEAMFPGQYVAAQAGIVTLGAFAGLTLAVFVSGKDFSFLGPILWVAALAAFGLIIASLIFGFNLGALFAFGMVILAAGFIVYDTSNVMHHYRTDQHVAAALALFGSVALMFYYVLRLFMYSRGD
jgi:FtsH-binding integral membrane protein